MPDAHLYKDEGSNTLCNIAKSVPNFALPNMQALGLGNIAVVNGVNYVTFPTASFGKMAEVSKGKDSTTGHWELAGIHSEVDFSYFPNGFPEEMIQKFISLTGCKSVLGNKAASGTEIIKELGEEHLRTGYPIVYTSADSVFQIAAHEEKIPLERLYQICKITREEVLTLPHIVGRVIARPFIGVAGNFKRTTNRKDFSLDPPSDTAIDVLRRNNVQTIAIGKIGDLFNERGIHVVEHTHSNYQGCNKILEYAKKVQNSLIFVNLVDFDVYFGHRNDVKGFARALYDFDSFIPKLINLMDEDDALILTADHGNDPTTPSTDHSREYVPLLYYRKNKFGRELGVRSSFSDVAKTVCSFFKIENDLKGVSFV